MEKSQKLKSSRSVFLRWAKRNWENVIICRIPRGSAKNHSEMVDWCQEMTLKPWAYDNGRRLYFSDNRDFMAFKLTWGEKL